MKREQSVFRGSFLLQNFCLIIIPMIFCSCYLLMFHSSTEKQVESRLQSQLSNVMALMQMKNNALEQQLLNYALTNEKIMQAVTNKEDGHLSERLFYAKKEMQMLVPREGNYYDMNVISAHQNVAVGTTNTSGNLGIFFATEYPDAQSETYFQERYLSNERANSFYLADQRQYYNEKGLPVMSPIISLMHYIPNGGGSKSHWIQVRWTDKQFSSTLANILRPGDTFALYNAFGEVLISEGMNDAYLAEYGEGIYVFRDSAGEKRYYVCQQSDDKRFIACFTTSYDEANAPYRLMRYGTLLLLFVALLATISMGMYIASSNQKPVDQLLSILQNKHLSNNTGNLHDLQKKVMYLIQNNKNAIAQLEQQQHMLTSSMVEKLLHSTARVSQTAAERIGIVGWKKIGVLSLHVIFSTVDEKQDSVENEQMSLWLLSQLIQEEVDHEGYVHVESDTHIVVLLHLEEEIAELQIHQYAKKLLAIMENVSSAKQCVGVSEVVNSWREIAYAYLHACDAMNYAREHNEKIITFMSLHSKEQRFYFSSEDESRLCMLVQTGHVEEMKKVLGELWNQQNTNWEKNLLAHSLCVTLIRQINAPRYTISAETQKLGAQVEKHLRVSAPLDEVFDKIVAAFTLLCNDSVIEKRVRKNDSRERMFAYIEERYCDPQFGMQDMLSELDKSQTSFQNYFFEQTGETFYRYLETRRLERAKNLMLTSEMTISQIAENSGYASDVSFRRAFKRCFGVSPSEWKKVQKKEEL